MTAVNDELLGDAFIAIGKRIKAGKCEMSQEQKDRIFSELEQSVDIPISKEQACSLLGISRSTFDARVAAGELPEGRHRRGFKEKIWIKRELYESVRKG